ncbi:MAG: hypothetical protein HYU64_00115 [Armatimonadetes bacterium]|nr:hypothetical protein [Armatimonadota bacterium]
MSISFSTDEIINVCWAIFAVWCIAVFVFCLHFRNRLRSEEDAASHFGDSTVPLERLDLVFMKDGTRAAIKDAAKGLVRSRFCNLVDDRGSENSPARKYFRRAYPARTPEQLEELEKKTWKLHFVERAVLYKISRPVRGYALISDPTLIAVILRHYEDEYSRARIFHSSSCILWENLMRTARFVPLPAAGIIFAFTLISSLIGPYTSHILLAFPAAYILLFPLVLWLAQREDSEADRLRLTVRGRLLVGELRDRPKKSMAATSEADADTCGDADVRPDTAFTADGLGREGETAVGLSVAVAASAALESAVQQGEGGDAFSENLWLDSSFDGCFDAPYDGGGDGDYGGYY